jgi:ABC-type branched-subunit amino acid transport system ATPase component
VPGVDGRRDWTYERALATFPRLAERLDHGGAQLSGGEQQMLTIGRALLTNPDLLILDEATEGLAPLIAREIWRHRRRHPRAWHRHADRRQELPRRDGDQPTAT